MTDTLIQAGTILVSDRTALPHSIRVRPSAFSRDWSSVSNLEGGALAAALASAGWSFFYLAGAIKKRAFGFDADTRCRTAVGRVIRDVQSQRCNCLEITRVTMASFLGMPYVSIAAHARHIQQGSNRLPGIADRR